MTAPKDDASQPRSGYWSVTPKGLAFTGLIFSLGGGCCGYGVPLGVAMSDAPNTVSWTEYLPAYPLPVAGLVFSILSLVVAHSQQRDMASCLRIVVPAIIFCLSVILFVTLELLR